MLLGVGVDIIKISRIRDALENSGKVFLDEVFTEWEQKRAQSHHDSAAYLSMTFAGKEAIFKCFGIGWETGVKLREIEIREGDFGEPCPTLSGKFASLASVRGVAKALLSLSYDADYAIGVASLIDNK